MPIILAILEVKEEEKIKTVNAQFIPTKPGKYFVRPFWNGKHQSRQIIECYHKECLINGEVGYRTELVCDYEGYSHLVALTGLNKWEERMKTEITKEQAIGKTIKGFVYSFPITPEQLIVYFEDNTFTTFCIIKGYESGDEEIINRTLNLFDFPHSSLIEAGIFSKQELETLFQDRDRKQQKKQRAADYIKYKQLKAKFED